MKKHLDRPDDDNPEWTDETTARAVGVDDLPESLRQKLRRPGGTNKVSAEQQHGALDGRRPEGLQEL